LVTKEVKKTDRGETGGEIMRAMDTSAGKEKKTQTFAKGAFTWRANERIQSRKTFSIACKKQRGGRLRF